MSACKIAITYWAQQPVNCSSISNHNLLGIIRCAGDAFQVLCLHVIFRLFSTVFLQQLSSEKNETFRNECYYNGKLYFTVDSDVKISVF